MLISSHFFPVALKDPINSSASFLDEQHDDYTLYDEGGKPFLIKSFMCFKMAFTSEDDESNLIYDDPKLLAVLAASFSLDNLTKVGKRCFEYIYSLILNRFMSRFTVSVTARFMAPIVNLCQCSGSGKSKFALDSTKKGPGFYMVLRLPNDSGYPNKNNVSVELMKIFSNPLHKENTGVDLNKLHFLSTKSTRCSHLIARIITTYMVNLYSSALQRSQADTFKTLESVVKECYALVQEDVEAEFPLVDGLKAMVEQYRLIKSGVSTLHDVTMDDVTEYIKKPLENPLLMIHSRLNETDDPELLKNINTIVIKQLLSWVADLKRRCTEKHQ